MPQYTHENGNIFSRRPSVPNYICSLIEPILMYGAWGELPFAAERWPMVGPQHYPLVVFPSRVIETRKVDCNF